MKSNVNENIIFNEFPPNLPELILGMEQDCKSISAVESNKVNHVEETLMKRQKLTNKSITNI